MKAGTPVDTCTMPFRAPSAAPMPSPQSTASHTGS